MVLFDKAARPAVEVLAKLDRFFLVLRRQAREPALAQLRCLWWRDALDEAKRDEARDPLLIRLHEAASHREGARLAEAHATLISDPRNSEALAERATVLRFAAPGPWLKLSEEWAGGGLAPSDVAHGGGGPPANQALDRWAVEALASGRCPGPAWTAWCFLRAALSRR